MSKKFGEWLRDEINRVDTNVSSLAAQMRLAHTSVRAWVEGDSEPKPENIQRLSLALGLNIADIYIALGRVPGDVVDLPEDVRRVALKLLELTPGRRARLERYIDLELEDQEPSRFAAAARIPTS